MKKIKKSTNLAYNEIDQIWLRAKRKEMKNKNYAKKRKK